MCRLFDKLICDSNPTDGGGYRRFKGVKIVTCCDCWNTGFKVLREPRSICTQPQRTATNRNELQRTATNRNELQRTVTNRNEPWRTATNRNELSRTVTNRTEPRAATGGNCVPAIRGGGFSQKPGMSHAIALQKANAMFGSCVFRCLSWGIY